MRKMEEFSTEALLKVLDSSLSHIKWRLKASSTLRLQIDVLALCSGMRPVVMVDYGGKLPELQERLCALLKLCQKESCIFEHLRVMIIDDMIYLVHARGLAEHVQSSLNSESPLLFVDIEQDPPKLITQPEKTSLGMQFLSVQKHFAFFFPVGETNDISSCQGTDNIVDAISNKNNFVSSVDNIIDAKSLVNSIPSSQPSEFIDLSCCLQDTEVTIPTLNGWLLGYPVVYAFGKEHIADAICNLSTKPLHIFKISVCRHSAASKRSEVEELLSFSVPYDLSMGESNEQWAKEYLAHMQMKWQKCKQVWSSLTMDVIQCYPQAIVL